MVQKTYIIHGAVVKIRIYKRACYKTSFILIFLLAGIKRVGCIVCPRGAGSRVAFLNEIELQPFSSRLVYLMAACGDLAFNHTPNTQINKPDPFYTCSGRRESRKIGVEC